MTEDLYELLGVERDALPHIIKAAYRRLAAVHHPDRGGDQEMFVAITTAYNALMDPKLREMYDLTGSAGGENRSRSSIASSTRWRICSNSCCRSTRTPSRPLTSSSAWSSRPAG